MEHENDIDDLFQQSFENFEVLPPDEVKRKIDEALFGKRKRRFFGIWFWTLLPLAGIAFLTLLWINTDPGKQKHTIAQQSFQATETKTEHETAKSKKSQGTVSTQAPEGEKLDRNNSSTKLNTSENPGEINHTSSSAHKSGKSTAGKSSLSKKRSRNRAASERAAVLAEEHQTTNTHSGDEATDGLADTKGTLPDSASVSPADSLALASGSDSLSRAKKDDTSENDSLADNYVKPERKPKSQTKLSPYLVGVQFGLTRGINSSQENVLFRESNPFYVNLDASFRPRKIGVSSGFNYFSTSETATHNYTQTDTVQTGITYDYITEDTLEYIYDSNQVVIDSIVHTVIIDSTANYSYDIQTNSYTQSSVYRVSYFSLPLMLSFQQRLAPKLYLDLMAGGVISYQKLRFKESNPANDNVTLTEFGFRLCVKSNLRYQFSEFGVSLNSNFNYDLKPVQYLQKARKRQAVDFGVGIWYNF